MPWTTDEHGEKKYVLSAYCKEELPTWDEMYNEFWKNKAFCYSPDVERHQALDIYWKIPRRKVILATACNQLNKMIHEDGLKKSLSEFIFKTLEHSGIIKEIQDIMFIIDKYVDLHPFSQDVNICFPEEIPIYKFDLPTGKPNPFELRSDSRVNLTEHRENLKLTILVKCLNPLDNIMIHHFPASRRIIPNGLLEDVVEFMMRPYIDYFENGIGWKDDNGKVIQSDPMNRSCVGVGYDPAL